MSSAPLQSSRPGSGSATPSGPTSVDIYRPLAKAVSRPLAPLLPSSSTSSSPAVPPLPTLLGLDKQSYPRLSGKHVLLSGPHAGPSELVTGKKRNRGDPAARAKAAAEHQAGEERRRELGVSGERKRRRVAGGVVQRREKISYESLLPLHYLHCTYLSQLLHLPPLPVAPIQTRPNDAKANADANARPSPVPGAGGSSPFPSAGQSSRPKTAPLPTPTPTPTPPALPLPPGLHPESIQTALSKSDFTGSHLLVLSSRNPSLVGIEGIVIEETASTFRLVSPDHTARVIPKNGTQFELSFPAYSPAPAPASIGDTGGKGEEGEEQKRDVGDAGDAGDPGMSIVDMEQHLRLSPRISLTLLGTSFGFRSGDRAGRKFRPAQGGGGGSGWGEEWVEGEWSEVFRGLEETPKAEAAEKRHSRRPEVARGGRASSRRERVTKATATATVVGATAAAAAAADGGRGEVSSVIVGLGAPRELGEAKVVGRRKRGKSRRKDPPTWGRFEEIHA
ncbi:hypothetical protein EHS25_001216 [Saitozyma podzolica]|uniref:Uncharacterized protein n=1 Tax=Saitozyma podzolica TaxID=1890683 RepID=A0A427YHI8_9TREE|nr:hypothetical protein EHS25_001216 [Saitozyma podzolica]